MTKSPKFKIGDRVAWREFGLRFGLVERLTPVFAYIHTDRGQKEKRRIDGLRLETQEDVAAREYKTALDKWMKSRPEVHFISLSVQTHFTNTLPFGVSGFRHLTTPDEIRAASDELRKIADWFECKPKEVP